jgi:hypothetical protein
LLSGFKQSLPIRPVAETCTLAAVFNMCASVSVYVLSSMLESTGSGSDYRGPWPQ